MTAVQSDAASTAGFFTRRRLRYGLIASATLWVTYLISVLMGPGHMDLADQAVGNDFSQFYAAGVTIRSGDSAQLYDMRYQFELEQEILGPPWEGFHAFLTPPFHAWVYVPFTHLPYEAAVAAWSVLGFVLLYASIRLIGADARKVLPWAISFFPFFATISFGQNAMLSMVILAAAYALWRRRRLVLAGLVLSLILYKPQLALGVLALWGLQWRRDWRALGGFALGSLLTGAFSWLVMGEATRSYLDFSREVIPNLATWSNPSVWHMHTFRAFFELLIGAGTPANLLGLLVGLGSLVGFIGFWRKYRSEPAMTFAAAVVLTMLVTPHGLVYDWVLFLIPAILLWERDLLDRGWLTKAYVVVWFTIWFAGPITRFELLFSDHVIQLSMPILAATVVVLWRKLMSLPVGPEPADPDPFRRRRPIVNA